MFGLFRRLFFVAMLCLVVVFALENATPLGQTLEFRLDLYFWNGKAAFPLAFLLVVCFLLGVLTAGFHGLYERLARRVEIGKRDKRIRALEKELAELRSRVEPHAPPSGGEDRSAEAAITSSRETRSSEPQMGPTPSRTEEEPTL
jgi:uncharacterized integral membrane protein